MCEEMSVVDLYDDIIKLQNMLIDGSEQEFMRFAINQEKCRLQWLSSVEECSKLKKLLDESLKEVSSLETKLQHARNLIDQERKKLRAVVIEKQDLERKIALRRDSSLAHKENINYGTVGNQHRKSKEERQSRTSSVGSRMRTSNCLETSCSVLSELSFSRDDLDSLDMLSGDTWKKMRPSLCSQTTTGRKSSGSSHKSHGKEVPFENKIVSVPRESISQGDPHISQASIIQQSTSVLNVYDRSCSQISREQSIAECLPPDLGIAFEVMKKINSRQHCFTQKIVIKPEECNACLKRINFGKMAIKCDDCKVVSHPQCKEKIPLPCIPCGRTPKIKIDKKGSIVDFVPMSFPMVPSLVVHCINEIESRGLSEVGIYRIPGSDKNIKNLKDKFLQGKGAPNLCEYDIHVVCGVLKDFLRNLKEPLITHTLWSDFAKAAHVSDPRDSYALLYQAISQLPKPNQDTLSYLILHLQKVASCRDCRMTMENLAKVFGPSISGNSSINMSPKSMYEETDTQHHIVESLMKIPSEYWATFINKESNIPYTPQSKGVVSPSSENAKTPLTVKENKNFGDRKSRKFFFRDNGNDTPHRNRFKRTKFFTSPK